MNELIVFKRFNSIVFNHEKDIIIFGREVGGGGSIAMMKIDEQSRGREALQILSFVTCHNSQ